MHSDLQPNNLSYSPSFSRFYNSDLADVAARVTIEFPAADDDDAEPNQHLRTLSEEQVDGDDFEFNLPNLVLQQGEIRPVYPVFDRQLLQGFNLVGEIESRPSNAEPSRAQNQLSRLFLEDLHPPSPDAEDLDRIPPGTYCVWVPNKSPSPGRCAKSSSTGSSATEKLKLWKLRDLLNRSSSDGKDGGRRMMLLTPKKKAEAAPARRSGAVKERAALERCREGGEKDKRRSYMAYKQGLVGFFVTPQVLRKSCS